MARILIVDDEQEIVMMLERQFVANGLQVIKAYDGQEGLNLAKAEKPDLVIVDEMMPKMDGYKLCALLKSDMRFSKIPVIMFTARAEEQDPEMSKEAGINLYLTKMAEFKDILAAVQRLLKEAGTS